jgi:uncharacterized protein YndB with AHSA1/START domain
MANRSARLHLQVAEGSDRTMDDRIEQQVTIHASVDRVWDLVTRPGWWAPTDAEEVIDRTPGHRTVRESKKWGRFTVEVVRVEPQTYAAFRWASTFPGEDPVLGKSTLVEFFVKPRGEAVDVTVVESGFAALDAPESTRESSWKGNVAGWQEEMASLKARAELAPIE